MKPSPFHRQMGWTSPFARLAPFHVKRPSLPWYLWQGGGRNALCGTPQQEAQLETARETVLVPDKFHVHWVSRLQILLWIATTAILLAIDIARDMAFGRVVTQVGPWTTYVLHGVSAVLLGAVLVAAGVLVRISRFTWNDRLQPGHWLIMNSAAVGVLGVLLSPLWQYDATVGYQAGWVTLGATVCSLMSAALFWFATTRLPEAEQWTGSFRVFALAHLFGALMTISFSLSTPLNLLSGLLVAALMFLAAVSALLALISFLSSVVTDLRTKGHRDWLHWLGVAVVAVSPLIHGAWQIARHFALP